MTTGSGAVIVWAGSFTAFTIYSGSPGVLLTDTIMFLVFLAAALVAVPFLIRAGGGWFAGIEALANSDTMPGILSWAGNPDYLYPDGVSNTVWAVTYGIVWALVVAISRGRPAATSWPRTSTLCCARPSGRPWASWS